MSSVLKEFPEAFATRVNKILEMPDPVPGNRENGWFAGYGCRWCNFSKAWLIILPFDMMPVAESVASMFMNAGLQDVTITLEAGLTQAEGGKGYQVSARI
mgnify:FL=1|jgi:hypothetical protein